MQRLFCVSIILILSLWCKGQINKTQIIGLDQGLSQSSVLDLAQDQMGFLWIATQDGLNRFDGKNFSLFKKDPFDSTSISANFISCLLVDRRDRLWVGTSTDGLNLFNKDRETFSNFRKDSEVSLTDNNILSLYEDRIGNIWIGTSNGFNYLSHTEDGQLTIQRFHSQNEVQRKQKNDHVITCFFQDEQNHLWVGTYFGLRIYELGKNGLPLSDQVIIKNSENSSLQGDIVKSICEDRDGRLWIGTTKGLNIYDNTKYDFSTGPEYKDIKSLNDYIQRLGLSPKGDLIAATTEGIFILPFYEGKYKHTFTHYPTVSGLINTLRIRSFHFDKVYEDILWAGTDLSGLAKIHPTKTNFNSSKMQEALSEKNIKPSVRYFEEDEQNNLFIGLYDGIVSLDKTTGNLTLHQECILDGRSIPAIAIARMHCDKEGQLWAGFFDNLARIHIAGDGTIRGTSVEYTCECNDKGAMTFYEEGNRLYFGTFTGLNYIDISSNRIEQCPFVLDEEQCQKINYKINSIYKDQKQNLWLGTRFGLVQYSDVGSNIWEHINQHQPSYFYHVRSDVAGLPDNNVSHIIEDTLGNIWIGTMNGLVLASINDGKVVFEHFNETDGLANNVVYGIVEDASRGHLWLSTNNGLSRFDVADKRFDNFDRLDGLQSNEFNSDAYFKDDSGRMYFGGVNGFTSFFPHEIIGSTTRPPVAITKLINAKGDVSHLLYHDDPDVHLNYNENSFSIHFAGIDFLSPQDLSYTYDLIGTDQKNISLGHTGEVHFSKLPPGDYTFRVKAINKYGYFDKAGDQVHIVINSPFWMKTWFYGILLLFLAGVFWLIYHIRYRMKVNRLADMEAVRKHAAEDFHDELGSKLTVISMYSSLTKNSLNGEKSQAGPYLDKVIETSNNLYDSMKDLLWALNPSQDSALDLFDQLKEFGEELFNHTDIEFHSIGMMEEMGKIQLPMDHKRHLLLICKEAMHNCLRHSNCKKVTLHFGKENNRFTIDLIDDGDGFDLTPAGDGVGLKNMKSRVEKINAKLSIDTNNSGTKISVTVQEV